MECEYLFCHKKAVARVTVPHLKARQGNCEKHLAETLEWAKRYRKIPGAVCVEDCKD
jgi:hypothetical protein